MLRALAFCARAYVKFKSSGTVVDMSAVELNKNKCGYVNIHTISQTPEEFTVPCDNQGTKSEDDTASLEGYIDGLRGAECVYKLRRTGCT